MKSKKELPREFADFERLENGEVVQISITLAKLAEIAEMTPESVLKHFREKTLDYESYYYSDYDDKYTWQEKWEETTTIKMGKDGSVSIEILDALWPYFEPYLNTKIFSHFREIIRQLNDVMAGTIRDLTITGLVKSVQEVFLENYEEAEEIHLDVDKLVSFVRKKAREVSNDIEEKYVVARSVENGTKKYKRDDHELGYHANLFPFLRELMRDQTFLYYFKHCFYINKREYV